MQTTKRSTGSLADLCAEVAALEPASARRVVVTRIEVDGDRATAHVAFVGSVNDGQTIEFALVDRDGQWKIDEMLSFVVLDRERLVLEQGREMMKLARSAQEVELMGCIVGRLDELDDAGLEDLILGFSAQPVLDLFLACEPRSAAV